jgi:hypothetical protein
MDRRKLSVPRTQNLPWLGIPCMVWISPHASSNNNKLQHSFLISKPAKGVTRQLFCSTRKAFGKPKIALDGYLILVKKDTLGPKGSHWILHYLIKATLMGHIGKLGGRKDMLRHLTDSVALSMFRGLSPILFQQYHGLIHIVKR